MQNIVVAFYIIPNNFVYNLCLLFFSFFVLQFESWILKALQSTHESVKRSERPLKKKFVKLEFDDYGVDYKETSKSPYSHFEPRISRYINCLIFRIIYGIVNVTNNDFYINGNIYEHNKPIAHPRLFFFWLEGALLNYSIVLFFFFFFFL